MNDDDRVMYCTLLTNTSFHAERESDYTSKSKSVVTSVHTRKGNRIADLANITFTAASNRRVDHNSIAKWEEGQT